MPLEKQIGPKQSLSVDGIMVYLENPGEVLKKWIEAINGSNIHKNTK